MVINPSELSSRECYKLLIGSVVPRPIAWVSTISKDGVHNLAPYSFFMPAANKPPMLCFSVGPREDGEGEKDTLRNICETQELVINMVSFPLLNAMHETSRICPPEVDEFKQSGVTAVPSDVVKAPRVEEALVSMECQLEKLIPLGTEHLVIVRMVRYHVKDELYHNGRIDTGKLQPVGRLAGNYTKVDNFIDLPI